MRDMAMLDNVYAPLTHYFNLPKSEMIHMAFNEMQYGNNDEFVFLTLVIYMHFVLKTWK